MLETINKFAPIINAITVLLSFGFVIWTTCFRKTRRDRIDELKVEMQVVLSQGGIKRMLAGGRDQFFQTLKPKFQRKQYRMLHWCAFDELENERKLT